MKKMMFIYNASAGKGHIRQVLASVLDIFSQADYEVTVFPTQCKGYAQKITEERSKDFDIVVCCGGDGTLHEVTQGLMSLPAEDRLPCGYLPAGTVNDFATSLNIPKSLTKAAQTAVSGKPFAYDICRFNDEFFTYVAAFGAFTDVSYETPQLAKNIFGKAAYFLNGIKQLGKTEPIRMRVEHDGEVFEDEFLLGLALNTYSVAGMFKLENEGVLLDDGFFEAIFIKNPHSASELQETLLDIYASRLDSKHFYFVRSSQIICTCGEEIPWTVDGEFGGSVKTTKITNIPRAVKYISGIDEK